MGIPNSSNTIEKIILIHVDKVTGREQVRYKSLRRQSTDKVCYYCKKWIIQSSQGNHRGLGSIVVLTMLMIKNFIIIGTQDWCLKRKIIIILEIAESIQIISMLIIKEDVSLNSLMINLKLLNNIDLEL